MLSIKCGKAQFKIFCFVDAKFQDFWRQHSKTKKETKINSCAHVLLALPYRSIGQFLLAYR